MRLSTSSDPRYRHIVFAGAEAARPGVAPRSSPGAVESRPAARSTSSRDECVNQEEWEFIEWLLRQNRLDHSRYRRRPLLRRIPACLRILRASDLRHARGLLERRPELLQMALDATVIGVTGFFRDPDVFSNLRQCILPGLERRRLSIWSAGCSDGAELYSMGMLLADMNRLDEATLLGSDCRRLAIRFAESGVYPLTWLKDVAPETRQRYFRAEGPSMRIIPALREAMRWKVADIFACRDEGQFDLILCRNVAIYLELDAAHELWSILHRALVPGGVLVAGRAERPPECWFRRMGSCAYGKR